MAATYSSDIVLNLGQVPNLEDKVLYKELLDIHNALEAIAVAASDSGETPTVFVDKFRNLTDVSVDYVVQITDGTVRVNAGLGDVVIRLPATSQGIGYRYDIKRIDTVPANKVTLIGTGAELIDGHVDGINISTKSSYTVKANSLGWDIL